MSTSGDRLLRLLVVLGSREWSTAGELADRLAVTGRTIRRDIRALRHLGYPIESLGGPGGGYGLGSGGRLPPLLLDDDEAVALAVGLRLVTAASMSGAPDAALRAAVKLEGVLPPSSRSRVDAVAESTVLLEKGREPVDTDLLVALADASHDRRMLRMSYRDRAGASSDRLVSPYRLVHASGRWYLVAHDTDRDDWRTFRVDRIESVTSTGRRGRWPDPPDPVDYVSRSVSTAPYRFGVRVVVDLPADELMSRVPATVGVVEHAGERSVLTTGADDLDAIVGHLVMLGRPFRVVEPPELAVHVAAVAERLRSAVGPATGET